MTSLLSLFITLFSLLDLSDYFQKFCMEAKPNKVLHCLQEHKRDMEPADAEYVLILILTFALIWSLKTLILTQRYSVQN